MRYDFYAYMDRMKYIKRWQLMRSTREENIMEHSQLVTVLAHALVTVHNEVYGGNADVLKTVLYATYHETSEVMTGDLPTPIKYYNRSIQGAYKELEKSACEKIVNTLPQPMGGDCSVRAGGRKQRGIHARQSRGSLGGVYQVLGRTALGE